MKKLRKLTLVGLLQRKIWPPENIVVKDVFREHKAKNEIILGLLFSAEWAKDENFLKKVTEEKLEQEEIIKAIEVFDEMVASTEKMRQKTTYVNVDSKKKEVQTPLKIIEKEVEPILRFAESLLKILKYLVEELPETKKETLKAIFSSLPEEVWKTSV